MKRSPRLSLFILLGLALVFGGCAPADPLDWKVHARTMEEFDEWNEANMPLMGDELAGNYKRAVLLLSADTPVPHAIKTEKQYTAENNALCVQINRLTVRDVVILGFEAGNSRLLMRISRESDKLLELLRQQSEQTTADDANSLKELITLRRQFIAGLKEEAEKNARFIKSIESSKEEK